MSTWLSTVSFTPASEPTSSKPCHTTVGWTFENAVVSARTLSMAPPPPLITYVPPSGSSVAFGWITGLPPHADASKPSTVPRANALRPSFTLRLRPAQSGRDPRLPVSARSTTCGIPLTGSPGYVIWTTRRPGGPAGGLGPREPLEQPVGGLGDLLNG